MRFLKRYAAATTLVLGALALAAFAGQGQKAKFDEIDVGRINVVEKDGKLRLVISNRDRSPGPIYKGQPFGYPGGTRPGMIFFNDEGSENGGLTFTGSRKADGTFTSTNHFSFDQFDQDQVLVPQYADNNGRKRVGMTISDRANVPIFDVVRQRDSLNKLPNGPAKTEALRLLMAGPPGEPLAAERVYVGRDLNKNARLSLSDRFGKARLHLVVDSLGGARVEFLDSDGRITYSVPDSTRRGGR